MIKNIKSTERILHRVELQRLQQERDDLVTEHIELMDVLNEMTEEIKEPPNAYEIGVKQDKKHKKQWICKLIITTMFRPSTCS